MHDYFKVKDSVYIESGFIDDLSYVISKMGIMSVIFLVSSNY